MLLWLQETPTRKRKQRVVIIPEKENKPTPRRCKKWCPLPGCRSKPQSKISQHLKVMHPDLTESERRTACTNTHRYLGSRNTVQPLWIHSWVYKMNPNQRREELPEYTGRRCQEAARLPRGNGSNQGNGGAHRHQCYHEVMSQIKQTMEQLSARMTRAWLCLTVQIRA